MTNPIRKVGGVELSSGTRLWYLTSVAEATRKLTKWSKDASGKNIATKTDQDETILRFKFAHNDPTLGEAFARIDARPTNASNGGLVKALKMLAPGEVTDDMISDVDRLWAFAKSLLMRPFFINTQGKGGFNNIVTVMPAPTGAPAVAPPTPATPAPASQADEDSPSSFDDDDIPF